LVWAREPDEGGETIPNSITDQATKDCWPSRTDEVVDSIRKIYLIINEVG
jgi:hypothetical protein